MYGQLNFLGIKTNKSSNKFKLQYPLGSRALFDLCARNVMRHSKLQRRDGARLLTLGDMTERELAVRMTQKENDLYQTLFASAKTQFEAYVLQGLGRGVETYGLLAPLRKACSGAGALNANVDDIKRRKVPVKKKKTTKKEKKIQDNKMLNTIKFTRTICNNYKTNCFCEICTSRLIIESETLLLTDAVDIILSREEGRDDVEEDAVDDAVAVEEQFLVF